jgi:hypothetical protein
VEGGESMGKREKKEVRAGCKVAKGGKSFDGQRL